MGNKTRLLNLQTHVYRSTKKRFLSLPAKYHAFACVYMRYLNYCHKNLWHLGFTLDARVHSWYSNLDKTQMLQLEISVNVGFRVRHSFYLCVVVYLKTFKTFGFSASQCLQINCASGLYSKSDNSYNARALAHLEWENNIKVWCLFLGYTRRCWIISFSPVLGMFY